MISLSKYGFSALILFFIIALSTQNFQPLQYHIHRLTTPQLARSVEVRWLCLLQPLDMLSLFYLAELGGTHKMDV